MFRYVFMLNFTINSDLKSLIIPLLKLNVKLINKQRLRIKVQVNGNSLPSTEWLTQKKPAEVENTWSEAETVPLTQPVKNSHQCLWEVESRYTIP